MHLQHGIYNFSFLLIFFGRKYQHVPICEPYTSLSTFDNSLSIIELYTRTQRYIQRIRNWNTEQQRLWPIQPPHLYFWAMQINTRLRSRRDFYLNFAKSIDRGYLPISLSAFLEISIDASLFLFAHLRELRGGEEEHKQHSSIPKRKIQLIR